MLRPSLSSFLVALGILPLGAPLCPAVTLVDLDFGSLPSAQGWSLLQSGPHADAGEVEGDVFNVSAGGLNQTTFGVGYASSTPGEASYYYAISPASILGQSEFSITWTTAVTSHEQTRQDLSWAAYSMSVEVHGDYFGFGIKPTELYTFNNGVYFTPAGFDGTLSHTYTATIDTDANTWELFVDGGSVASGTTLSFGTDQIRLGDGTGTANANGRTTEFIFSAVPEPSGMVLLLTAGAGFLLRRRR